MDRLNYTSYLRAREFGLNNIRFPESSSAFIDHKLNTVKQFYAKNLSGHSGCVNAIEFANDGSLLVSGKRFILAF